MKDILTDIQSGRFARDWVLENQAGGASFLAMRNRGSRTPGTRSASNCGIWQPKARKPRLPRTREVEDERRA